MMINGYTMTNDYIRTVSRAVKYWCGEYFIRLFTYYHVKFVNSLSIDLNKHTKLDGVKDIRYPNIKLVTIVHSLDFRFVYSWI